MAVVEVFFVALAVFFSAAGATDPGMLQDVCVADLASDVKVNGFPCKATFKSKHFFSKALAKPRRTSNKTGSTVTSASVLRIPGLNTLGLSLARIDYAPGGINPPHTHPRASEVVFVLAGRLEVGFITTAGILVSKTIEQGDVFVFPRGLVHFQKNIGHGPAAVIAAFDSQLPGTQSIAATLFASKPRVDDDVLAKSFQIDDEEVKKIRKKFARN